MEETGSLARYKVHNFFSVPYVLESVWLACRGQSSISILILINLVKRENIRTVRQNIFQ